jgi:hypothetical protein
MCRGLAACGQRNNIAALQVMPTLATHPRSQKRSLFIHPLSADLDLLQEISYTLWYLNRLLVNRDRLQLISSAATECNDEVISKMDGVPCPRRIVYFRLHDSTPAMMYPKLQGGSRGWYRKILRRLFPQLGISNLQA